MKVLLKIILSFFFLNPAFAEYQATGQFKGQVCTGSGIKSCKVINIYAVDDKSGKLYKLKKRYKRVDEYSNNHCYLRIKKQVLRPNFYTKTANGKYEKVDIDYLQFNCQKR